MAPAHGANKKWGFFPSVGVSWNVSEEDFFSKYDKVVNSLKLRLTAGRVGNANFPAYSSIATINSNGYYFGSPLSSGEWAFSLSIIQSGADMGDDYPVYAGIDAGLLKKRITLRRTCTIKTTNLYITGGGLIPLSTGYSTASENIGAWKTKGGAVFKYREYRK